MNEIIKEGDGVTWVHEYPQSYCHEPRNFNATGFVLKIYQTTVGAKHKVLVAKIAVTKNPYWDKIGRKSTVIKLDKLNKIG